MRAIQIALATAMLSACSQPADRLIEPGVDQPRVDAAMAEASKSLPQFWAKFDAREPGTTDFVVKLAMPAGHGTEYIWADPVSHSDTEVVATLANEPFHIEGVHSGSRVIVRPEKVVDWTYEKNGKLYGHFTTRALLRQMTAAERAQVEPDLSPTPLEAE
jgi:uncharacterized protein YegJ (DUF2314 family)